MEVGHINIYWMKEFTYTPRYLLYRTCCIYIISGLRIRNHKLSESELEICQQFRIRER